MGSDRFYDEQGSAVHLGREGRALLPLDAGGMREGRRRTARQGRRYLRGRPVLVASPLTRQAELARFPA